MAISVQLPRPIQISTPSVHLPRVPRFYLSGVPTYKNPSIDFLKNVSFPSPTVKTLNKLIKPKEDLPRYMSVMIPRPLSIPKPPEPQIDYISAPPFAPRQMTVRYLTPPHISLSMPSISIPTVPITFPTLTMVTTTIPFTALQAPDVSRLQSLFFLDVVIPSLPITENALTFTNRSLPERMSQIDRCVGYRKAEDNFISTARAGLKERVELDTILMNIKLKTFKYQTQVDTEQRYYKIILTYYDKFISNLTAQYNAQAKLYEAQVSSLYDKAMFLQAVVKRNQAVANYFRQAVQMNKAVISANSSKIQSLETLNQLNRAAVSVYEKYISVVNKIRELNTHNLSILQNYIQGYDAAMGAYITSKIAEREVESIKTMEETLKLTPVYTASLDSLYTALEAGLNKEYEEYKAEALKLKDLIPILKERITLEMQRHSLVGEKTQVKLDSVATEANNRISELENDLEMRRLQTQLGLLRAVNQLEKNLKVSNGELEAAVYELRKADAIARSEDSLAMGRVNRAMQATQTKIAMSVIESLK